MKQVIVAACLVLGLGAAARSEEFILKDGTRIVGRIVAYESDSFRVETSFGQAIIYKDKVAKINFTTSETPASPRPAAEKKQPPAKPSKSSSAASHSAQKTEPEAAPSPAATQMERPEAPAWQQSLAERSRSAPPPHIVDRIEGNTYINETFHFRMFKPPGWRVFEGVTRGLGPAIVIMGTEDESTLLMVGRESFDGSLEAYATASERGMAKSYGKYRRLSEAPVTVNGLPAIRRTFTGSIDGADWYGLVVYFGRGQEQFAIVGLTTGELHDFTQALFRKVVNTFEFYRP